jgi:hypothetical protein
MSARWDHGRRFSVVEDLLGEPRLDALIASPVPFELGPELYERLDRESDSLPCHVFEYGS